MRTETFTRSDTGEKRKINIRALKRKEIRSLKNVGYNYVGCVPTIETLEETIDRALDLALSENDLEFLDECDNQEAQRCWNELLKETYGSKDEEKNSSATTSGIPTPSESNTAKNVQDTKNSPPPA